MLFEIGVGDAYGASFEFASDNFIEAFNDGRSFHTNPTFGAIGNGKYTDDTQMSLALAENIFKMWPWEADLLCEHFFNNYKRDPRYGYSRYLHKVLTASTSYEEMMSRLNPQSDRSGAAMRSCPIGVFNDIEEIKRRCEVQAKITHNTDGGIISSMAVALATHYSLYRLGDIRDVGTWLNTTLGFVDWSQPYEREVGNTGFDAAMSAISVASRANTYTEVLMRSVALGGDVDTTAAVAMGIASVNPHFVNDLHEDIFRNFENGAYGQQYLREVDEHLMAFARNQGAPV